MNLRNESQKNNRNTTGPPNNKTSKYMDYRKSCNVNISYLKKAGTLLWKKLSRLSNSTAHSKLPSEISWLPALSGIPKKGTIPEEWI